MTGTAARLVAAGIDAANGGTVAVMAAITLAAVLAVSAAAPSLLWAAGVRRGSAAADLASIALYCAAGLACVGLGLAVLASFAFAGAAASALSLWRQEHHTVTRPQR